MNLGSAMFKVQRKRLHIVEAASVYHQSDIHLSRDGKTGMTKPVESPASTTPSLRKDHHHAFVRLIWMLSHASQCNCALTPQISITL